MEYELEYIKSRQTKDDTIESSQQGNERTVNQLFTSTTGDSNKKFAMSVLEEDIEHYHPEDSTLDEYPDAHDIDDNTEQDVDVIVVTQTDEWAVAFDELSVVKIAFGSATVSITENPSVMRVLHRRRVQSTRVVAGVTQDA
jgi:hypothetical protein